MVTRYTVSYWYLDEHDVLKHDCDTYKQAVDYANKIDRTYYKDISIYAQHWQKVNKPLEYQGIIYNYFEWELIDDEYYKEITSN